MKKTILKAKIWWKNRNKDKHTLQAKRFVKDVQETKELEKELAKAGEPDLLGEELAIYNAEQKRKEERNIKIAKHIRDGISNTGKAINDYFVGEKEGNKDNGRKGNKTIKSATRRKTVRRKAR